MTRDGISRRSLLRAGAVVGGAAATHSLLPPSLHRAMAAPVRPGGLRAVEHVIVLMQENRSFDHYYGTLRGVRGFGDHDPLRQPNGRSVFHQPNGIGEVLPFSLREAAAREGRPGTDIQYLGDLPHGWTDASAARANGWNNGWVPAKGAATMTHYDRADVPLQYELADTFTILDAYHCSIHGSTNPNRNFLMSGTTGYEPGTTKRAVTNAAYSYDHAGYEWTSYPERLQAAGVSWQVYQEWDNFTDNALEYFLPYKKIGHKIFSKVNGKYRTTEEFYYALFDKPEPERRRLLEEFEAGRAVLTPEERALFDRGAYRSEPDTLAARLRADIAAGTLPKVSWLVPTAALSEHPGASTPVGSANLIYQVLDAIASDVDTWSKTVLLINFDENDGYFDHVPAPVPASVNEADFYDGKPLGLGPRVPMTIVSPWTVGGFVDSTVADHTSVVRFLERWTGVEEPNISPWRRQVCGDLTSAFDFERPGARPRVDVPGPIPPAIERWHPTPPVDQRLPEQEAGRRPARALPYQPSVSARVDGKAGDTVLALTLANAGRAPAHFAVYPYAGELPAPAHRDVSRRHEERIPLRDNEYRLSVQGPNRFWCELAGTVSGAAAGTDVRLEPSGTRLAITVVNRGTAPVTVTVKALRYGNARHTAKVWPGQERRLPWPTEHGWYDLEATVAEDASFRRRVTGRVEDGRPGVSA
ncbi:phospholipase C [Herbihabitans rhizosphaerae]|uniref:phospholipase C n=1 Tax=Herbihabitans rhizosphaerae TaxID=1872711 RepID=A0A4Q7KW00_9PSEU|nr:phospholipase C, phosphocholine-specific [Herbihabitans rhizosphaerae]RZS40845.1 phospholipase C [Herbihabitans rhizosphaerae]